MDTKNRKQKAEKTEKTNWDQNLLPDSRDGIGILLQKLYFFMLTHACSFALFFI